MTNKKHNPAEKKAAPVSRKLISIDPVTRVEGHGKVTIVLDEEMNAVQTRLHIVEFRGFERFIQGRLMWEVPVIVQRLCGICPVSHHLASVKAMDRIIGADVLTPTAEKMRRFMHYGQILQSHATHFFYLASPDLLFGIDAPASHRSVAHVALEFPDIAKMGIALRKFGQEIIKAAYGKRIHGTGAIPGGINKNLPVHERDAFLKDIDGIIDYAGDSVSLIKNYTLSNYDHMVQFGALDSNYLSIVGNDGAMDLYDGKLRAIDHQGSIIFDGVDHRYYLQYIAEEVRDWSYMKFPFLKSLGPEQGWYRVGSLARINTCSYIDTESAEAARKDFFNSLGTPPVNLTMATHWARLIEILHAAEKIKQLLLDPDLQGNDLLVQGERRRESFGILEAPRGTLFHHYQIGSDDLVTMANLIVSTTQNNEPMNRSVHQVVEKFINKKPQITEGMLNHIEAAIRAYDPCLSCATHAVGQMPLVVSLYNSKGILLQQQKR